MRIGLGEFSGTTYARARLLLGASCVGFFVVISALSIAWGVPGYLFSDSKGGLLSALFELLAYFSCTSLLLFPFEVLGGALLPRGYALSRDSITSTCANLLRSASIHVIILSLMAWSLLLVGRIAGPVPAFSLFPLFVFLQIAFQERLFRLFSPGPTNHSAQNSSSSPRVEKIADPGESFTGGILGFPGREKILIPERWVQALRENELGALLSRRLLAISSGARRNGIILSVVWVTVGAVLSLLPDSSSLLSTAGLVSVSLWFTLWTFLGLLLLPSLSRAGVFYVDQKCKEAGVPRELLESTLLKTDFLGDTEYERSKSVESIFHPIPSPKSRLEALSGENDVLDLPFWNVNRLTLFLSWSGLSLLTRSVHCNCGRPHLWVLMPVD